MRKILNQLGNILLIMALFTGCQKNEDISVIPNDENVARFIDNEQAKQILDSELPKLKTNAIANSGLKSTQDFNTDIFRAHVEYSEDPNVKFVYINVFSNRVYSYEMKVYPPDIPVEDGAIYRYIAELWQYKNNKWEKANTITDPELGKYLHSTSFFNWRTNEFIAFQILIYSYPQGYPELIFYTGVTRGIGIYLN